METTTYGQHLLIDGYGADSSRISSLEVIYRLLDELPALIGMQKIGPPQLVKFTDEALAGITGFILIVTSHVSIHTYSLKGCFYMDVFSCKPFDPSIVIASVKKAFDCTDLEVSNNPRGSRFPAQNLPKATERQLPK
jgi:S-adenosylmethionine decarboxylase